jgi:hypothetical protein
MHAALRRQDSGRQRAPPRCAPGRQVIAEHFYREGRFATGDRFCKEAGVASCEALKAPYTEMHRILEQVRWSPAAMLHGRSAGTLLAEPGGPRQLRPAAGGCRGPACFAAPSPSRALPPRVGKAAQPTSAPISFMLILMLAASTPSPALTRLPACLPAQPQLRGKNLRPALEWAQQHRAQLSSSGQPAAFEFKMHALQFVHLLTSKGEGGRPRLGSALGQRAPWAPAGPSISALCCRARTS